MSDRDNLRWFARSRVMVILLAVPSVVVHIGIAVCQAVPEALSDVLRAWKAVNS